jgi:hypothetical protein
MKRLFLRWLLGSRLTDLKRAIVRLDNVDHAPKARIDNLQDFDDHLEGRIGKLDEFASETCDLVNLGFLNTTPAALVAAIVLAIEHAIEAKTTNALFGAVRTAPDTK